MELAHDGPMAIPLWIGGRAYLTVGDSFFDVINPATGRALRRVPMCSAEETAKAVAAARDAQAGWQAANGETRRAALSALADALERYAGHFARLLTEDLGLDETRAQAEVGEAVHALRSPSPGESGVCALVVDATRPLAGLAAAAAGPLLAGATLVVKPSPQAPSAAYALCELAQRGDWPAGVLNLVHGDGPAISGLCAAGVDRLIYAGAPALGAQVGLLAEAAGVPFELRLAD